MNHNRWSIFCLESGRTIWIQSWFEGVIFKWGNYLKLWRLIMLKRGFFLIKTFFSNKKTLILCLWYSILNQFIIPYTTQWYSVLLVCFRQDIYNTHIFYWSTQNHFVHELSLIILKVGNNYLTIGHFLYYKYNYFNLILSNYHRKSFWYLPAFKCMEL